jgi:hypothetical protein
MRPTRVFRPACNPRGVADRHRLDSDRKSDGQRRRDSRGPTWGWDKHAPCLD